MQKEQCKNVLDKTKEHESDLIQKLDLHKKKLEDENVKNKFIMELINKYKQKSQFLIETLRRNLVFFILRKLMKMSFF